MAVYDSNDVMANSEYGGLESNDVMGNSVGYFSCGVYTSLLGNVGNLSPPRFVSSLPGRMPSLKGCSLRKKQVSDNFVLGVLDD